MNDPLPYEPGYPYPVLRELCPLCDSRDTRPRTDDGKLWECVSCRFEFSVPNGIQPKAKI